MLNILNMFIIYLRGFVWRKSSQSDSQANTLAITVSLSSSVLTVHVRCCILCLESKYGINVHLLASHFPSAVTHVATALSLLVGEI